VVLVAGLAAFLLGVVLAVWPGETVKVLAYLLAFQLIVLGVAQVFVAFGGAEGAQRWAAVLSGVISFGVGVLFLFDPLQTLTFIGWIIGICVIAVGAADLLGALMTRTARHRLWQGVRGLLGVVAGLLLVANPNWSLGAVVVIAVVWLVGYGFLTIFAAFALRAEQKRSAA
jgi:uncharacterized membrane protein HdeD (DUF308 family)